jgi:MYXO-CTERM domain-containing protein
MWIVLLFATADAGSLRALVEVGPGGTLWLSSTHSEQTVQPAQTGEIEVLDAAGNTVGHASVPDPRVRSVILPDGGSATATLDRARVEVWLPWPDGAETVRLDGKRVRPQPLPPPPTTTSAVAIQESGDQADRLDLVVLGDGYTADQLGDFAADTDWIIAYLLEREPYGAYKGLFNIWRVDLASTDSGVSHREIEPAVDRETALGCYYGCADIARLVCCDDDAVLSTVAQTVPDAEGVLVLINDPAYGGAGGFNYATAYVGEADGRQVAAHELGHSLIGLWDEYGYGIAGTGDGPNCASDPAGHWPSWEGTDGVASFQECTYIDHYRPTENQCMMRSLRDDYCPVCREQAVLAMYGRLPGLIEEVSVPPGTPIDAEGPVQITATPYITDVPLNYEWTVDGVLVGEQATFDAACVSVGETLSLTVYDPTHFVREDPAGLLIEDVGSWPILAGACAEPAPIACGCEVGGPGAGWWLLPLAAIAGRRRREP